MRKIHKIGMLVSILAMQCAFADDSMQPGDMKDKPCIVIAKACSQAGYMRGQREKGFWHDCMEPILLGQTVSNVHVDSSVVKSCRTNKIQELKMEIKRFEEVK